VDSLDGYLIGLVNRALTEDGGIDGARLAASERDRAAAWLRSGSPAERSMKRVPCPARTLRQRCATAPPNIPTS